MCQLFEFETLDIQSYFVCKQTMFTLECWLFSGTELFVILLSDLEPVDLETEVAQCEVRMKHPSID